ncbi:ATP-binding protein [Hahella sp. HN01]|uniref:ATP-binding protein n=1 Tax=Hahella sp. HN01 TaxID=2847262 RepID=UPI001C1EAB43|nr:ATP-binding protein [Hahella sp. HN01]MBU6950713.1 response regulator [Hahella sp. HN01]
MKISINNRLSFRLARNTVAVALLLGMVLSLIQVIIDFLNEKNSLDAEIRAVVAISHAPASQIAYNIDARLAAELLDGLLEHPSIIHAEIIDTDNRLLASKEREPQTSAYRWLSDLLFQPSRTYTETLFVPQLNDFVLGDLNVVVDTYPSGAEFLKRAAFTLVSGFLRSLILSAVLLILFYIMLTQPLVKVISAVSEVDPETPEKIRLPVPKGHEMDEIGVLVNSTNNQLQAIDENLNKLKKAESRLKTYSEQLEQIVDSRTKELSEKNKQLIKSNHDLRVAKEEAVSRAKARADFLANMSHEIRTPFNGVLGMISLTLEEPLSEKQKEQLNVAYSSGVALLELLNDILDISKVEAGKLTLENIAFDLRKTVEDVSRLLAQNAHAKNVALYTNIDPTFPERVYGDPTRIRQIVSNLTGNAIKFTETGSVTVSLSILKNQSVEIRVSDTGIGIEADRLESIFSPFSQGDADITRKYGGTGLGLTLCRQLVTHMGGKIEVNSERGRGSSFMVTLPLLADHNTPSPKVDESLFKHHFVLLHQTENRTFECISAELQNWKLPCASYPYEHPQDVQFKEQRFEPNTIILFDSRSLSPLLVEHQDIENVHMILVARQNIPSDTNAFKAMRIEQMISAPVSRDRLYDTLYKAANPGGAAVITEGTDMPEAPVGQKHVLLVEDNQVNQLVAKTILRKLGYEVSIANNGQDALDLVGNDHYDIILMDCHMPVMDGYEATRLIRQNAKYDALPIIAVTANVMQGDKERCLSCGMNDYLTKPYEKKALTQMLAKWLEDPVAAAASSKFA